MKLLKSNALPFEIEPLNDWLLVKLAERGKTPGGLHLPEGYDDETPRAEVVSVGQGEKLSDGGYREPLVKKGDVVLLRGNGIAIDKPQRLFLTQLGNVIARISSPGN